MITSTPVANVDSKTVTHEGTDYTMRPLTEDSYTVLVEGVPVGRVVFTFGAANGVVEDGAFSEELLTAIGEVWFAAIDG